MSPLKSATFALSLILISSSANALTFQFDITNVEGNFGGNITGFISGLTDETANQEASSVILTSAPSSMPGVLPGQLDFVNDFGRPILNSFSVSGGEITSAQFGLQVQNADLPDVDPTVFESLLFILNAGALTSCCGVLNNGISFDNTLNFLGNDDGISGIEFSNVSAIPLPAAGHLMFGALVAFGALRKKGKRHFSSTGGS